MIGKLIIQGKAWGEFESAKRSKGNIEISGYRSYGGTHTVRMVDQPQLNENQQIVLEWLKEEKNNSKLTAFDCIYSFIYGNPEDLVTETWAELNAKEEAQVLEAFGQWVLEQEE
ncbi:MULTISPECIES: hypothetical protein [Enterococcus]|uniref:hypothetical protein n=1 Tax=Enterococcus TaxID=1350 RepID=UPI0034A4D379